MWPWLIGVGFIFGILYLIGAAIVEVFDMAFGYGGRGEDELSQQRKKKDRDESM